MFQFITKILGGSPSSIAFSPRGMKSSLDFWNHTPWDRKDKTELSCNRYGSNAGRSTAVMPQDGWHNYIEDQLALMNHLGIDKFNIAGMCIGGPYCLGKLIRHPVGLSQLLYFRRLV